MAKKKKKIPYYDEDYERNDREFWEAEKGSRSEEINGAIEEGYSEW
jgi:hypothetical protein